jgi:hypothetical protein
VLIRYLKARQWSVKAAEEYFRKAADWRDAHDVPNVFTSWNLEAYEKCLAPWWLSGGFFRHGLRGEQIAYERLAITRFEKLFEIMPWEEIEKLDIVHCMRSLAALEEDSLRTGHPIGNGIIVQDCHGFGWGSISFKAAKALSILIQNRNQIMPECLSRILIVRAPAAWIHAWNCFKYLLDPGVVDKVRVAGERETLTILRKFIHNDNIPAYLGGGAYIDGDPECRKILAPGGLLPEEAKERFYQLKTSGCSESGSDDDVGACFGKRYTLAGKGDADLAMCGVCPRRAAKGPDELLLCSKKS